MPKMCAVCKKGTSKVPTFVVTQKRKEIWEYVIPIALVVGDRICRKHFPESFLTNQNVSDLSGHKKRVRVHLKSDAFPMIETSCSSDSITKTSISGYYVNESKLNTLPELSKSKNIAKELNENDNLAWPLSPVSSQVNRSGLKRYRSKSSQIYNIPVHTVVPCIDNNKLIKQEDNIFEHIYLNPSLVSFPTNWSRIIPSNSRSVIFSKIEVNNKNHQPFFERSVSIDEQANIKCSYLNNIIETEQFYMNQSMISSIHELESIIIKVENAIMCEGINIPNELLNFKPKTVYTDNNGQLRHSNCLIIVQESSNISQVCSKFMQCNYCKVVLKACKKKKLQNKGTLALKRVRFPCTPSEIENLKTA